LTLALPNVIIDPRANVESNKIGDGTCLNAFCWICEHAVIGRNCNIISFAIVGNGVVLEDDVTVMSHASIGRGAIVRTGSFIGPHVVVTNDMRPRSPQVEHYSHRYRAQRGRKTRTLIGPYASIGANSVIIPGAHVGAYAFVAAGSVVTRPVPPYALVRGNPARFAYWVDRDGNRVETAPP
jgi:UDP-2-acetamido-3-amino-2,3-dideoxy-glucuronate N-acetyltransferase